MIGNNKLFIFALLLAASLCPASAQNTANLDKAENLYRAKQYPAALAELERISPSSQADRETVDYYTALCRIYMGSPDAAKAVEDFIGHYPASTRKVEMVTSLADELFARGRYGEAVKFYDLTDKFSLGQPRRDDYVYRKAYSLYASGDYDAARPLMYSLLSNEKWGHQAAYAYGHMCYAQGDMSLALQNFLTIKDDPAYADKVPFYLVNIYFKQKDYDQAIAAAQALLAKAPASGETDAVGKIIGQSYFNTGRFREALPYLTAYAKNHTPSSEDYYQIGFSQYKSGDYPAAIASLGRITGRDDALAQNAYFALGQSYLASDRKSEALGAFRSASLMAYDPALQHDAWYNYACLSYEAGNPYEPVTAVLSEYLRLYPESPTRSRMYDYLLDSFLNSRDYLPAIQTIESMGLDSPSARQALSKASFYLAGTRLAAGDYDQAVTYYRKASASADDQALKARADFWLAEAYLQAGMDTPAREALSDFKANPASRNTPEYIRLPYQEGYIAEKSGNYPAAQRLFTTYEKQASLTPAQRADVRLHLADCAFAQGQYAAAQSLYDQVASSPESPSRDYAVYQKSLCQGITGNYKAQIATLADLLKTYPESPWRAAALYQTGMAFQKTGQPSEAIASFLAVEKEKAAGDLVPEAKSKAALAYYNQGDSHKALALYQEVAEKYPSSPVTPSALRSVRQILVEQGRSDDFIAWSQRASGTPLDQMAVDSLHFETGQKAFSKGDFPSAAKAFGDYLSKYPSGLFTPDAAYYLAESQLRIGDTARAKSDYKHLLDLPPNKFSEGASVKYTGLLRAQDSLEAAVPYLEKLYAQAQIAQNKQYAIIGLLEASQKAQDWENTIKYAGIVRRDLPPSSALYADASTAMLGALVEDGRTDEARPLAEELKSSATGQNMALTLYYLAVIQYRDEQYDQSVETLSRLTLDYPSYKHTGSRALLLMAQNFFAQGDLYQGGYILDNVISGTSYPDIRKEALALKTYMDSQNKTTGAQAEKQPSAPANE